MKSVVLAMTLVAGCATTSAPVQTVTVAPPQPVTLTGHVVVTRLVDTRTGVLRKSRGPREQLHYSLLAIGAGGFWVNGTRTEGATYSAGDHVRVAGTADAASAMEQYARTLLGGEALDKRVSLNHLDGLGLGISDGVVVVPVLDQLDLASMSSDNSMSGASSYESGRRSNGDGTDTVTTTTTAGAASSSGGSSVYANARMRLIVIELAAGKATSRRVIYGRGAGSTLDEAIAEMGAELARGLAAIVPPPVAPPPALPAPVPPPDPPADRVPDTNPPPADATQTTPPAPAPTPGGT